MTQNDIVNAIKNCKEILSQKGIIFNQQLVNTLYCILKNYYIENKKYVILQAPTGSGKSIIGLCLSICSKLLNDSDQEQSYYLTSTKALQEQFNRDKERFRLNDSSLFILKGTDNYVCDYQLRYNNEINNFDINPTYKNRTCVGMSGDDIAVGKKGERFIQCNETCEYKIARYKSVTSDCSILNYHYFITVLNSYNPYFDPRFLTICDEAHEISKIINDTYSYDINAAHLNKCSKHISEELVGEIMKIKQKLFNTEFTNAHENPILLSDFISYFKEYIELLKNIITKLLSRSNGELPPLKNRLFEIAESLKNNYDSAKHIIDLCENRIDDLYIETKWANNDLCRHIIKDLDETSLIHEYFLSNINKGLFMSATINVDDFVDIYGLKSEDYAVLKLPDSFNYEKSPIRLINSGWLNYKNFDENIDNVLFDVISIVHHEHPNDKGIIHTHTSNIKEKLRLLLINYPIEFQQRFLFYNDSKEKEYQLKLQATDSRPLIMVGPSLTTGIDLKDDLARFNILIKTPYPPLSDYIKRKMSRYPTYYNAATKEEIIQTIGRTNRNVDDYSIVYLLDCCFGKLVFNMNDTITNRIKKYSLKEKYIIETPKRETNENSWDDIFVDDTDDLPF